MTDFAAEFEKIYASMPARTYEDCDVMRERLDEVYDRLMEPKGPIAPRTMDAIAAIAASSPFKDIHDPDAEIHHRQTPQTTVCLHALRYLVPISHFCAESAAPGVERLEALARDNLDYDVRKEAVMSLWSLSMWKGPAQECAIQALERQGKDNDCAWIRMLTRDNLLQTSREYPDMAPRAWTAQINGAEDPDAEARTRALALLTNRVKENECGYEEANSLMKLFRAAAAKAGHEEETVQYWAERGIADIQKRRLEDMAARGCTTLEDVKPSRPIKFQQPK